MFLNFRLWSYAGSVFIVCLSTFIVECNRQEAFIIVRCRGRSVVGVWLAVVSHHDNIMVSRQTRLACGLTNESSKREQ